VTTVAELRKEQLKAELASLETQERQKKTIASEFGEADAAVNEASRLVRVNALRLSEEVTRLDALSKQGVPQGMSLLRSNNDVIMQQINQSIHELTVESDRLTGELNKKKHALGLIVKQIAEHPAYSAVRQKQRDLVAEATKLASTLFKVPLADMGSILKKISLLSEAENKLISDARSALRDGGLPEVKPVLGRFIQQITPQQLMDALPNARTQVTEAVDRVTEFTSRDVLR
jgi:hypothetical protein